MSWRSGTSKGHINSTVGKHAWNEDASRAARASSCACGSRCLTGLGDNIMYRHKHTFEQIDRQRQCVDFLLIWCVGLECLSVEYFGRLIFAETIKEMSILEYMAINNMMKDLLLEEFVQK